MANIARLFQRDLTVIHPARVADRYGGTKIVWTAPPATTTPIKGFLQQTTRGEESIEGARDVAEADYVLYCEAGTPITEDDRVAVDGLTLYVTAPPVAVWGINAPHHLRVELRRVEG